MDFERIASFSVDHTLLDCGIYLSRFDFSDIATYDIRVRKPNAGQYLDVCAVHTTEHLVATYVRNSDLKDHVVYFGPMGCLTGYYLLLKNVSHAAAIALIQDSFSFVALFEGKIPGSEPAECGNFAMHNLAQAKSDALRFLETIKNWAPIQLVYPK